MFREAKHRLVSGTRQCSDKAKTKHRLVAELARVPRQTDPARPCSDRAKTKHGLVAEPPEFRQRLSELWRVPLHDRDTPLSELWRVPLHEPGHAAVGTLASSATRPGHAAGRNSGEFRYKTGTRRGRNSGGFRYRAAATLASSSTRPRLPTRIIVNTLLACVSARRSRRPGDRKSGSMCWAAAGSSAGAERAEAEDSDYADFPG